MATVRECITVPDSASPAFAPAKLYSSPFFSISSCQGFTEFKGRKVRPTGLFGSVSQGSGSSSSLRLSRGRRIVCEAQKTTVDAATVTAATWQSLVLDSEIPVLFEFLPGAVPAE